MQLLIHLIILICLSGTNIYIIQRLNSRKISIFKNIIISILIGVIIFLKCYYYNNLSCLLLLFILLFLYNFLVYKDTLFKTIICTSYVLCLNIVFKLIYFIISYIMFNKIIYSNLYFIFLVLLVITGLIKKIYIFIINISHKLYQNKFICLTIITFILSVLIFNTVYFGNGNKILLYFTVIGILVIYFIFIILFINFYSMYSKIVNKYSFSLECLTLYEELINKYRVSNHENRNQLLIIRNLGNYKLVKRYIDKMIDNQDNDSKSIEKIVNKIPSSHLRAVFYSKLTKMQKNGIEFSLVVGRNVSSKLFLTLDDNTILDMCNIINILLDNAIDSTLVCNKKILIDINKNKYLSISISNSYNNELDLSKIYDVGYTTKGKGHGYGLSLVRDLVLKNKRITNETEILDSTFIQTINIDI